MQATKSHLFVQKIQKRAAVLICSFGRFQSPIPTHFRPVCRHLVTLEQRCLSLFFYFLKAVANILFFLDKKVLQNLSCLDKREKFRVEISSIQFYFYSEFSLWQVCQAKLTFCHSLISRVVNARVHWGRWNGIMTVHEASGGGQIGILIRQFTRKGCGVICLMSSAIAAVSAWGSNRWHRRRRWRRSWRSCKPQTR